MLESSPTTTKHCVALAMLLVVWVLGSGPGWADEPDSDEETTAESLPADDDHAPASPPTDDGAVPETGPAPLPTGTTAGEASETGPAPPESAPADWAAKKKLAFPFSLGSYGRVIAGTDLRGGAPEHFPITAFSPRTTESNYFELDVYFRHGPATVHLTVALMGNLFHFDGDLGGRFGVRNLYAEAAGLFGVERLHAWIGSQMVRGDDIYLLDFWPLDELNIVGGGLRFDFGPDDARTELTAHVGLNRLNNVWQLQLIEASAPAFGAEEVIFLNRLRYIGAARVTHERHLGGEWSGKVRAYVEAHGIGDGTLQLDPEVGTTEALPADHGFLAGFQVGIWGFGERQGFANLFARVATGLAAYGELSIPFGFDNERRAASAREVLLGISANYDFELAAITLGGYFRYFRDADPNVFDRDDLTEGVAVLRATLQPFAHGHVILQASYEAMLPRGLTVAGAADRPAMWRLAVMPLWSPLGRGTFTRPHLRLVYSVALPNADARGLLNPADPRALLRAQHFLGFVAEWWFNSSFR